MAYVMTFGRNKGKPITEVPEKDLLYYISWDAIRPDSKAECEKELARRRGGDNPAAGRGRPATPAPSRTTPLSDRARDIITVGYNGLRGLTQTDEAMRWLISLVDGSGAPDSEVPF